MANHKSALKRIRQSETRRKRNQHIRTQMRTVVKRCREAFARMVRTQPMRLPAHARAWVTREGLFWRILGMI